MVHPGHDSEEALEAWQLSRLRPLLGHLRRRNRFYAPRLEAAGLDGQVASLADFRARMPHTLKRELAEDQAAHPPYGTNLSAPLEAYVRLHQTSSTSGTPLRWLDTAEGWSWMLDGWVNVLERSGVRPDDRVLVATISLP